MTWTADKMRHCASTWTRGELLNIWNGIKHGEKTDWPSGKKFEYLVIRAFDLEQATIRWPYQVCLPGMPGVMEQLDGVVYLHHRPFLIESKNLSGPAAIEAVAKLRFQIERRPPGTMGLLFSTSDFSLPTETFAQYAMPMNVLLWGRHDLDVGLENGVMLKGLQRKLQKAAEFGVPMLTLGG